MKKLLFYSLLAVLLISNSCGGGSSGGGGGSGSNPVISNLQFSPKSASQGQMILVSGSADFSDQEGNLATITFKYPNKTNTYPLTSSVKGKKSGQLLLIIGVDTSTKGTFPFEVWVTDETGLESNHLTGTFTVT